MKVIEQLLAAASINGHTMCEDTGYGIDGLYRCEQCAAILGPHHDAPQGIAISAAILFCGLSSITGLLDAKDPRRLRLMDWVVANGGFEGEIVEAAL